MRKGLSPLWLVWRASAYDFFSLGLSSGPILSVVSSCPPILSGFVGFEVVEVGSVSFGVLFDFLLSLLLRAGSKASFSSSFLDIASELFN